MLSDCIAIGAAGAAIGLILGLLVGAYLASRIEDLPVPGRIRMRMQDVQQRRKLREWMARNVTNVYTTVAPTIQRFMMEEEEKRDAEGRP